MINHIGNPRKAFNRVGITLIYELLMPTTIPYDPSLILGNIVTMEKLTNIEQISQQEAPVNAAEDELNSLISLKRSIDMTTQEMVDMGIDVQKLQQESQKVGQDIEKSAINFASAKLKAEQAIQPLRAKISMVNSSVESPIDYNKTQIKKMPLAADSLKMNCQYFAFDQNVQDSSTHSSSVASFVSDSFSESGFGGSYSAAGSVRNTVQSQMNSQHSNHSIAGTLVISINCTHKDALLLAPYVLDVDKAIRVWNAEFPKDQINTMNMVNIMETLIKKDSKNENKLELLSGATFGSSFVGMVHVLNTTETDASETMYSVAESIQGQFEIGGWFAHESGGFGVDANFAGDAKNLLSTQNIQSHCTLCVMGSIPSIKSNNVKMAVQGYTNFDGSNNMKQLEGLQASTNSEFSTVASSAAAARTGGQMVAMQNAQTKGVLSGLSEIDNQNNKILDTNSMMDSMEDYIEKCLAGNIGIPINYYLKPITKSELTGAWLKKYHPNKFNNSFSSGDDSEDKSSSGSGSSGQAADAGSGN